MSVTDNWDPRRDSGGRRPGDPGFGTDEPAYRDPVFVLFVVFMGCFLAAMLIGAA